MTISFGWRLRGVVLFVLLLLVVGCRPSMDDESVDFRVPVSVREVAVGSVENVVRTSGTLRVSETIQLRAETSGVLAFSRNEQGTRIGEGDRVKAGQSIAEITGDDVRLAARSESNEQRFRTAERNLKSTRALFEEGLVSEIDLHVKEDAFTDAQLEWDRSRLTIKRSTLVTPIDGIVLSLGRDERNQPIAEGQLVTQGETIAKVAPNDRLVADVDLIGSDIARARSGLSARVIHHAWPDRSFEGRVGRLAPSIDPQTRALRAEVEIINKGHLLRPGMFVEVVLIVERRSDVPTIPRRAVTERGGRKVVFVIKGQKAEEVEVKLGFGDDRVVEVISGVVSGDQVVITGIETLTDGASVRVTGS